MRCSFAVLACAFACVGVTGPAFAQALGERLPPPQPLDVWQPSGTTQPTTAPSPRPAARTVVDPWQFVPPPVGFTVGAWQVLPQVTAGAFYDDNVFATNSSRKSDWAYLVRPELGLRTAGQNYSFVTQGFVEDRQYTQFTSQPENPWG